MAKKWTKRYSTHVKLLYYTLHLLSDVLVQVNIWLDQSLVTLPDILEQTFAVSIRHGHHIFFSKPQKSHCCSSIQNGRRWISWGKKKNIVPKHWCKILSDCRKGLTKKKQQQQQKNLIFRWSEVFHIAQKVCLKRGTLFWFTRRLSLYTKIN